MRSRTAGTNLWEELTAIAVLRVWIVRQIESHKLSPVSIIQDGYHLNKSKYRSNAFHELKRSCSKAGGGWDLCAVDSGLGVWEREKEELVLNLELPK